MQKLADSSCGALVPTVRGQQAFVPGLLPREMDLSPRLVWLLDRTTLAVGTLAGEGKNVQNTRLLIRPLLRREAVLSSRIEGTVASLSDVFSYEAGRGGSAVGDVREVVNYVEALEYGIERLNQLPISFRLINEMHTRLMAGVRGQDRHPSQFRRAQVWIGSPGSPIEYARFIPPPPEYLRDLFYDWERFANDETMYIPPLIRCGMMHYQIEAIHPYEDGNGRIGRLLITLILIASGVMPTPLLYMSAYFERQRQRYYFELLNLSITCDWERWLTYFLTGLLEECHDSRARIGRIQRLQEQYREILQGRRDSGSAFRLTDELFASPIITVSQAAEVLGMTRAGARRVLDRLLEAGIVHQDRRMRPQRFVAREILEALENPIDLPDA